LRSARGVDDLDEVLQLSREALKARRPIGDLREGGDHESGGRRELAVASELQLGHCVACFKSSSAEKRTEPECEHPVNIRCLTKITFGLTAALTGPYIWRHRLP
jgi:hypothetical protein